MSRRSWVAWIRPLQHPRKASHVSSCRRTPPDDRSAPWPPQDVPSSRYSQTPRSARTMNRMRTIHEYMGYVFTIDSRPAEPIFTVDFADFPEIITSGDTLTEAFAN